MIFQNGTPFNHAWDWMRQKIQVGEETKESILTCPDCCMPIDSKMQKTNIRMEEVRGKQCRILSCCWCYCVFNLGPIPVPDPLPLYC